MAEVTTVIFLIFSFLFTQTVRVKDKTGMVYVKLNYGLSNMHLNSNYNDEKFRTYTVNPIVNYSILPKYKNHFLGFGFKSSNGKEKLNFSWGFNYSYLFFLKNNSFFSFNFFVSQGKLYSENLKFSNLNSLQLLYFKNIPTDVLLIEYSKYLFDGKKQKWNYIDITPSIGYDYPIFDGSGLNFGIELFYAYSDYNQKNINQLSQGLVYNSNEAGFRFSISGFN